MTCCPTVKVNTEVVNANASALTSPRRKFEPAGHNPTGGLDVSRNGSALGCGAIAETEHHIIKVAITPSFRGIVAFDDGMLRRMEMLPRVPVG